MGGISRRFWAVIAIILLVNVSGLLLIRWEMLSRPLPGLRLLSFSPQQAADDSDRIVLRFDEPVMRIDQCNARLEHSPYVIEPAPPAGHWRWEQPDQLVYMLESKLPAGREFTIRPADDIETQLGRRVVGDAQFTLRTGGLALLDAQVMSSDDEHATVELHFNQPVRSEDVVRHVKVKSSRARSAVVVQCLTQTPAAKMLVRFTRPRDTQGVQLIIAAEMIGDGGTLAMGKPAVRDLVIHPRFKLRNADLRNSGGEAARTINLWFTRRIATDKPLPASAVTVSPKVDDLTVFNAKNGDFLALSGSFISGTRYRITANANLLSHKGEPLGSPQSLTIEVPDRDPVLRLPDSRGILSPHGNLTLDLKTCNIEGFTLGATRLHANNLVPHLRGEDEEATSRRIVERLITLKSNRNQPVDVAIDLRQLLDKNGAGPGVYHIHARAKKPYWLSDSSTVTISDLAITAKKQAGGHHVFITSLQTAKPVAGVSLRAITYSNQALAEAETDEQGVAILKASSSHPDGPVWLITAQLGDDLNFIQPQRRQWVLDEVKQTGRAHPATYDAMLYTERGVYRPGDMVHLTAIVREPDGRVAPPMPLMLRVKRPDGRIVAERPIAADATGQGMVHVDFASPADGQLGRYEFQLSPPGSGKAIAATGALIEAFVPIRIEVDARPTQMRYGPGEKPQVEVGARYLFGQPASELPMSVSATLQSQAHESKRFSDFTFETGQPRRRMALDALSQQLDAHGRRLSDLALTGDEAGALWKAQITATVTEPGGRSVSQNAQALIDTIGHHAGLRMAAGRTVRTNVPVALDACLVTGRDEPGASDRMLMIVERIEHDWVLEQVDGNAVWKSVERIVPVKERRFAIGRGGLMQGLSFACAQPGNHRVSIRDEISGAAAQARFYVAETSSESTSPPVTSPERVEMVLDRESYEPGTMAKVIVRSPFAGTLMLSVETDRVTQQFVLPMERNTAVIDLPVAASLRGGAYLVATVIRPLQVKSDKWLPHRAMGMVRLDTDHANHAAAFEIDAPATALPGEEIAIQVRAGAEAGAAAGAEAEAALHSRSVLAARPRPGSRAMVHLWAVDDGILLTTNHRTPDPLAHFFAPRAPGVSTADVFADLLPDHERPSGMMRIGAGDDEEESLRRSPVPMKQREAAVVWRAAEPLNEDGTLSIRMKMPRITGRMRIMAVVVDGDRYGSSRHNITLTSPLLVEANWPRFAAPGDRFEVPVKLFNSTGSPVKAKLSVALEGPVVLENDITQDVVAVAADQPTTLWLKAKATGLGQVKAAIRGEVVSAADRAIAGESETLFTIRPITPLHVETNLVRIKAGQSIELPRTASLEPGGSRITASISGRPMVELRPAVEELLDYPYGCLEQTTSRLMAILHAPQLLALESSDDVRIEFANEAIASGIARIWSMQTRGGGLSYWPGSTQPTTWGTAYASLFLVYAQRAGHRVDARLIDDLTKYLGSKLNGEDDREPVDANLRAMICHVLAAWDHAPHGWIARLGERLDDLDLAGRAHLAAAWSETGRNDRALAMLPQGAPAVNANAGRASHVLSSRTRQDATLLTTLLDIDRGHEWIVPLVQRIEARRTRGSWGGTLDNAAAIGALSKYQLSRKQTPDFKGELIAGDDDRHAFDHRGEKHVKVEDDGRPLRITSQGRGDIYVTLTTQGLLKADAITPYQRGLRIERRWKDRQGNAVDPMLLKVGDLIRVEIELSASVPGASEDDRIEHIAIVDALPGGVEVENPRLATSAAHQGEASAVVERVEFLDDRVVLFAGATKEPQVFRYMLRVTTTGRFALPPVQASSMYDGNIAAMGAVGRVMIDR